MKHLPKIALLLLLLAVVAQAFYYYPRLPVSAASHFNAAGKVDGWSNKTTLVMLNVGVSVLVAGLFFWIESAMKRASDALINLPNKEYWLAPARRAASLRSLCAILMFIGVGAQAFFFYLFYLTYEASLTAKPMLPTLATLIFWPLLLAGVAALAIVVRFPKPSR